jgi:hypothetical protein
MCGHYRPIVVRVKPARPLNLLGRAEQSSSNAALRRAEGAEFDGESADRATIKLPRCASSSDTVRESEYQILHISRGRISFLPDASAPECLAGRPYCLASTVDSDRSESVDSTRCKSASMLDVGVGL